MSTPLSHALPGERYLATVTPDGQGWVVRRPILVVILEHQGVPWVAVDHSLLAPAHVWSGWEDCTYERVLM
jgi:hypothetical protein